MSLEIQAKRLPPESPYFCTGFWRQSLSFALSLFLFVAAVFLKVPVKGKRW